MHITFLTALSILLKSHRLRVVEKYRWMVQSSFKRLRIFFESLTLCMDIKKNFKLGLHTYLRVCILKDIF